MVTSNAAKQQTTVVAHHDANAKKTVQVAEAYSYLSDQKEINLDSIPLPLSPPPSKQEQSANSTRLPTPPSSTSCSCNFNILDTVDSFEVLEQTIIKQKRLARFKNTDLRRKILLKRTFDLVCEIMDHENGFDFEDETETINKKQEAASKKVEDDDDDDDEDSSSDSDSDSSDDDDDDDSSSSSSSSGSSDESDEEEEEEERESIARPNKQQPEIDQLIPKPSESKSSLKIKLEWSSEPKPVASEATNRRRAISPAQKLESNETLKFSQTDSDSLAMISGQEPEFSVVIQDQSSEDLDFTELNSIDITGSYDDSAFNLDQVTYVDEQPAHTQLYELKTFQDNAASPVVQTNLKRKRNSFEETVHQNEQDLFGTSSPCDSSFSLSNNNDQQIFYANPSSLASLSDSTCFYNNQPSISPAIKSVKRAHADDQDDLGVDTTGKRFKSQS